MLSLVDTKWFILIGIRRDIINENDPTGRVC